MRDVKGTTVSGVIRRSFRIGLWLGLLTGIGLAIAKIFRPKPEPSAVLDLGRPTTTGAHEWPRLEAPAPVRAVVSETAPARAPTPEPQRVEQAAKKPAEKKAAPKKKLDSWVDPDGNICPDTHPVKGKLSSMIFQVPGNFAYDRTKPDRCYESATAAETDGLRAAKR